MKSPAITLCLSLCIVLAVCISASAAESPSPREARLVVNAAQALIDQQLGSLHAALTVLATSSEVHSLDWETMHPLLSTLQGHCPPCAIWLALPDGTYYTVEAGLMDQTLTDRKYFGPLMNGEDVLGEVVVSKSTGQLSAIVAVPVYKDGQVIGALGASVFVNSMADYLAASLEMPTGMSLLAMTAAGQMVCAIQADGPMWAEALSKYSFEQPLAEIELTIDGETVTVLNKVSTFNGWRYLVGIQ